MSRIALNLRQVQAEIAQACAAAGRDPASVRLLAASKTQPPGAVLEALAAGQRLFGENRAQELRDKVDAVDGLRGDLPRPEWHFIGHLQTNKVKYVVGRGTLIHSVDRLELGQALSERILREREGGRPLEDLGVLVEVNISGEQSKEGVPRDAALALCSGLAELPGLSLRGLMTMPPWTDDPADSRPVFEGLARLAEDGRRQGLPLFELSMGMSRDLEHAIACGATIVRVGTAIFGAR